MRIISNCLVILVLFFHFSCTKTYDYDIIIRNGTVYNGSGEPPVTTDIAVKNDTIAAIGDLSQFTAGKEINAKNLAVAPGFINMLSWAVTSLIHDGRSQSDIRQGVTLEVFGEGTSMGPLNDDMKQNLKNRQKDIIFDIEWTTLNEGLEFLEKKGVSCNMASFIGATSVRIHEIGYDDRQATPQEMERMKALVRQAMQEGAVGISSSLIYVPATFASTEELIELAKVAAEYDGLYISHMRSEGDEILEAVDELLSIAKEAGIRAEIYHLKSSGQENWHKLDAVIERVNKARAEGLQITADMYTYPASSTGLNVLIPSWAKEGGHEKMISRLQNPDLRKKIVENMNYASAGSPDNILLIGFRNDSLKYLTGKTLAQVAELRGTHPKETVIDLIIEDDSRIGTVYFSMSEENVRKKVAIPWMSFCSDAGSYTPEGVFLKRSTHPRAYGSFARVIGKYVREEKIISLQEAIRRLTSFPANNLKIKNRGYLKNGYYADIVIFDPEKVQDHATFEQPHQFATGMQHVIVNGVQVLENGEHTGATPGIVVRGPGWRKIVE
jgi:N-acyl-D-amino-acid deacylase